MMKSIRNIAFAGTGNVAFHLAKNLKQKGYSISGVWSRNFTHAQAFADSIDSVPYKTVAELRTNTDLIIIAVTDSAIKDVSRSIGVFNGIVVHTAGSVGMEIFEGIFEKFGVLYPLQTFSKEIPVSMNEIPFFTEASSKEILLKLNETASALSCKVYETDSRQRLLLHVAAVFAGNYSNLMYIISDELINATKLPTDVLHPLITETARKAVSGDPLKTQTGPARRNDTITMEKHMEALATIPEYAELYSLLAHMIINKVK